jgi:hypothetical protein
VAAMAVLVNKRIVHVVTIFFFLLRTLLFMRIGGRGMSTPDSVSPTEEHIILEGDSQQLVAPYGGIQETKAG